MEMSSSSPSDAASKPECPGFEPQQWRRGVCKNCFRSAERHGKRSSETEAETSTGADDRITEHGEYNDEAYSPQRQRKYNRKNTLAYTGK